MFAVESKEQRFLNLVQLLWINFLIKYRKGLRRTAAVKPENRVLGIKFKDLSPVTHA